VAAEKGAPHSRNRGGGGKKKGGTKRLYQAKGKEREKELTHRLGGGKESKTKQQRGGKGSYKNQKNQVCSRWVA